MPQFDYTLEPVDEFEDVMGDFYGGRGQVGQQYVVTNRRLLMGPLDTGIAQEIDAYILNKAVPGGGDLIKNVLSEYAPMSPKMRGYGTSSTFSPRIRHASSSRLVFASRPIRIRSSTSGSPEPGRISSEVDYAGVAPSGRERQQRLRLRRSWF